MIKIIFRCKNKNIFGSQAHSWKNNNESMVDDCSPFRWICNSAVSGLGISNPLLNAGGLQIHQNKVQIKPSNGIIRRLYDNQIITSDQLLLTGEPLPKPFVFSGRASVGWSSTCPLMRSTTVEFLMALEVTVTVLLKLPARLVL